MGSRRTWLANGLSYGTCQICGCLRGEDVECLCDDREFDAAMDLLAENLRWGGALCEADGLGWDRCRFGSFWRPGCRRPARGEGK